jgi:hypothetical protein
MVNLALVCCFCGESLSFAEAVHLSIIIDSKAGDAQALFCHMRCLKNVLHESIPIHPDLLEN